MVAMVGWMCFKLYNGGFIQQVFQIDEIAKFHEKLEDAVSDIFLVQFWTFTEYSEHDVFQNVVRSVHPGSDETDLRTLPTIIEESSGHKQESDHLEVCTRTINSPSFVYIRSGVMCFVYLYETFHSEQFLKIVPNIHRKLALEEQP